MGFALGLAQVGCGSPAKTSSAALEDLSIPALLDSVLVVPILSGDRNVSLCRAGGVH